MAKEVALELLKILEEYSDKDHGLSKEQIFQLLLDNYGRELEEKAFYRKIEELQNAGFDIVKTKGRYSKYYLDTPRLSPSELLYLSVMLYGSSDIAAKEAKNIVDTLYSMSVHQYGAENYQRYRNKLRENNMLTRQINKFALLIDTMESKKKLSYKIVLNFEQGQFSEKRVGIPVNFSVENNLIYFVIDENGKSCTYQLKDLINVETVE